MRFVGVVGSIVPGVVGTSVGPVGFDVGPVQTLPDKSLITTVYRKPTQYISILAVGQSPQPGCQV